MTQPPIKKFVRTTEKGKEITELGEQHTQMMLKFARETPNAPFSPQAQTSEEIADSAREISKHIKAVIE